MISDFQRRFLDLAENVTRMAMNMRKSPRGTIIGEDTYFYTHPRLTVASGATQSVSIPIESDSDFNAYYMAGLAFNTATGAVVGSPFALIQLTDTGTGRTWLSEPAYYNSLIGNGGIPFILQNPTQLKAKSDLQISYTNLPAAGISLDIQTVICGVKVFYSGDQ